MATTSHWRMRAARAIEAALATLPPDADKRSILRAVDSVYPFGPRQYHPYKMWLIERSEILARRFPKLFTARVRKSSARAIVKAIETDGGLFPPERTSR